MNKLSLSDVDVSKVDLAKLQEYGINLTAQEVDSKQFREGVLLGAVVLLMEKNPKFATKMLDAQTIEEKYVVCQDYIDVSLEDFTETYNAYLQATDRSMYKDEDKGILSDEALDMVVGGSKAGWRKFWGDVKDAVLIVGGGLATLVGGALCVFSSGLGAPIGALVGGWGAEALGIGIDGMVQHMKS